MIVVQDSYLRLGYFTRTFDHHRSEVEFLGWVVRWWDGVKSCSCSTAVEAEIVLRCWQHCLSFFLSKIGNCSTKVTKDLDQYFNQNLTKAHEFLVKSSDLSNLTHTPLASYICQDLLYPDYLNCLIIEILHSNPKAVLTAIKKYWLYEAISQ